MRRVLICVFALGTMALLASMLSQAVAAADAPTDRVVVMYFHRTQRCPTCLKMGSYSEEAVRAGHGGGDYFEVVDFIQAILGEAPNPIDVHRAMDMTLPGLVSQRSILEHGAWLDVPNSRDW